MKYIVLVPDGCADEPLAELDAWLAPYRTLWSKRLDDLERHLTEKDNKER